MQERAWALNPKDISVITVGNDKRKIKNNMREMIGYIWKTILIHVKCCPGNLSWNSRLMLLPLSLIYSNIFTKAALSRITGINERQLWHYTAGVHKPRKQLLEKIQKGIQALTKELSAINLLWYSRYSGLTGNSNDTMQNDPHLYIYYKCINEDLII